MDLKYIEKLLSKLIQYSIKIESTQVVSGGCINHCYQLKTNLGDFFVKYNLSDTFPNMLAKESLGLSLLNDTKAINTVQIIHLGQDDKYDYLILEYIKPYQRASNYWEDFGRSLATLHKIQNDQFGLHFDNYIGSLNQINEFTDDWDTFFIECRIRPQLKLAIDKELLDISLAQKFENLFKNVRGGIFPKETPSLLHGDLWSGNVMTNKEGKVLLVDPSVYFGHREMELAFTKLFGRFDPQFYQSYQEVNPLAADFESREALCQLYPYMVHLNLFGSSYLSAVLDISNGYS